MGESGAKNDRCLSLNGDMFIVQEKIRENNFR